MIKDIWSHIKKKGLSYFKDPVKRKVYFDWKTIELEGLHLQADEILSFCEQVVHRRITCTDCTKRGNCLDCECRMDQQPLVQNASCSLDKWGTMLQPEDWNKYKELAQLQFTITYGK